MKWKDIKKEIEKLIEDEDDIIAIDIEGEEDIQITRYNETIFIYN